MPAAGGAGGLAPGDAPGPLPDMANDGRHRARSRSASHGRGRAGTLTIPGDDASILASPEQALTALGDSIFTEECDLVRDVLVKAGEKESREDMGEFLMNEHSTKDIAKDAAQARLTKSLMANYDAFIDGMKQVQEVDLQVSRAIVHVSNGLRKLRETRATLVQGSLRVVHRQRKRQRMALLRRAAIWIRQVTEAEEAVVAALRAGEFARAVSLCVDTRRAVHSELALQYAALGPIRTRMERAVPDLRGKLDMVLAQLCEKSDVGRYEALIRAYIAIDDDLGVGVRLNSAGGGETAASAIASAATWAERVTGAGGITADALNSGLAAALDAAVDGAADDPDGERHGILEGTSSDPGCIGSLPERLQACLTRTLKSATKEALVACLVQLDMAAHASAVLEMKSQAAAQQLPQGRARASTAAPIGANPFGIDTDDAAGGNDPDGESEASRRKASAKAERLRSNPFATLAQGVTEDALIVCVEAVFSAMVDIFHSHYVITQWHRRPFGYTHGVDGREDVGAFLHRSAIDAPDGEGDGPGDGGVDLEPPLASSVGPPPNFACTSNSEDGPSLIDGGGAADERDSAGYSTKRLLERARLHAIREPLLGSRPIVWHAAQQRAVSFLFAAINSSTSTLSLVPLVRTLARCARLAEVGEEYGGSDSHDLRGSLRLLCRQYYDRTHRAASDATRNILARESWQRLPLTTQARDKIISAVSASFTDVSRDELSAAAAVCAAGDGDSPGRGVSRRQLLPAMLHPDQHPFAEGVAARAGAMRRSTDTAVAPGSQPRGDDDSESEEEEVVDDVVEYDDDAEDDRAVTEKERAAARAEKATNFGCSSVVTASASLFAQRSARYTAVMQALPSVAGNAFVGLTNLFDYYLYTVAVTFVPPAALTALFPPRRESDGESADGYWYNDPAALVLNKGLIGSAAEDDSLTVAGKIAGGDGNRCYQAIANVMDRVNDELAAGGSKEDEEEAGGGAGGSTSTTSAAASGPRVFIGTSSCDGLTSEGSMFGVQSRLVALASLDFCLNEVMGVAREVADATMPASHSSLSPTFFARAANSTAQLEAFLCQAIAPTLFPEGSSIAGWITGVRWDAVPDTLEYNDYVRQISGGLERVALRLDAALSSGAVPTRLHRLLWGCIIGYALERMVEGFSRVKKCSMQGRGLMAMDVTAVWSRGQVLGPPLDPALLPRGKAWVDQYVQAFYYDREEDVLEWIRSHRASYSRRQVTALVTHGVGQGKKKKALRELLSKAEAAHSGEPGKAQR